MFLETQYPDHSKIRAFADNGKVAIRNIFFSNVCSAIRRDIWKRFPFDESLIMCEDQMWAKQVLLAGHRTLYEPRATVFHSHNYRLKDVFRRNFDFGAAMVGISEDTFASMAIYEVRHLGQCIGSLLRSADLLWIPYLLAYEFIRATAFAAGQRVRFLPRWLKRRLSLHRYYWESDGTLVAR
jgi:rhamnosyltransferase